jgi:hypothetical protein
MYIVKDAQISRINRLCGREKLYFVTPRYRIRAYGYTDENSGKND